MEELWLEDSTLREGEQSPGISFSIEEKVNIAKQLDAIGVTAIEVGTPIMGGMEKEAIKKIIDLNLNSRIICWNRGKKEDIDSSISVGATSIHIGLPTSDNHLKEKFKKDRKWLIDTMKELVQYAKSKNLWVSVSAEDCGRTDIDFLKEYIIEVNKAGADRIRCSDTVGVLDPFSSYNLFKEVTSVSDIPIMAHMHNDFGLATANTLAAINGGAKHVHFTVNGLGERSGIAPMDEIILNVLYKFKLNSLKTSKLKELAEYVAFCSKRKIPENKPVTGDMMFAHESGIHVDGVLKISDAFEPYPPELVGGERKIIIGKHSGSNAIKYVLEKNSISYSNNLISEVLAEVRTLAITYKRNLTENEVIDTYYKFSKEHNNG
ncbi:homoaconitate hydratase [Staphylococcus hominis]|uniref:homocitrate synthase/isopropylmalate synthase family protein n=1 Tax=Staphylococcus hominis TaxID=1290 RepID=UPI001371C810|nr:homoaconitate hydratase [Staphylococcus hominis]